MRIMKAVDPMLRTRRAEDLCLQDYSMSTLATTTLSNWSQNLNSNTLASATSYSSHFLIHGARRKSIHIFALTRQTSRNTSRKVSALAIYRIPSEMQSSSRESSRSAISGLTLYVLSREKMATSRVKLREWRAFSALHTALSRPAARLEPNPRSSNHAQSDRL
jgi:hypothetical protein